MSNVVSFKQKRSPLRDRYTMCEKGLPDDERALVWRCGCGSNHFVLMEHGPVCKDCGSLARGWAK